MLMPMSKLDFNPDSHGESFQIADYSLLEYLRRLNAKTLSTEMSVF